MHGRSLLWSAVGGVLGGGVGWMGSICDNGRSPRPVIEGAAVGAASLLMAELAGEAGINPILVGGAAGAGWGAAAAELGILDTGQVNNSPCQWPCPSCAQAMPSATKVGRGAVVGGVAGLLHGGAAWHGGKVRHLTSPPR